MNQQNESHHVLMLDIAREAIQQRSARDGYDAQAYDAKRNPEGYVTSLLNALHQWCHCHGSDWDMELARAQGFFEQDLAESQSEAIRLPSPTVEELRCPKCGLSESFFIEASQCLLLFPDGTVLEDDAGEQWGDWSYCRCHACQHMGTVYQFREQNQPKETKHHE